jgi:hypothetical protein
MVQFNGTRNGTAIKGTGYSFSKKCGAISFFMAGAANSGRSVVLKGIQPYVDPSNNCQVTDKSVEVIWIFEKLS